MDLNALQIFAHVAEAGSFTSAAKRLRLPLSTVSRKVAILEKDMNARLLERSTRNLRLTDIGRDIFVQSQALLEVSRSVEDTLSKQSSIVTGKLRVSAPPSLFGTLLGPLFVSFQATFPDIQIELFITNRFMDPIAQDIDAVFRVGPLSDSNLVAKRLLTYRHQLLASPTYLAQSAPINKPEDLLRHRLLTFLHEGPIKWHLRSKTKEQTIKLIPHFSTNDYEGLESLLIAGSGVGELPGIVSAASLRSGALKQVLPEWEMPEVSLFLVHSSQRFVPRHLVAFKDFAAAFIATNKHTLEKIKAPSRGTEPLNR